MNKEKRELAELMGWTFKEEPGTGGKILYWLDPQGELEKVPEYDTDWNAMKEVWKTLEKRGLWDRFIVEWPNDSGIFHPTQVYQFLNDLPSQVKAAIKVLKEVRG